jgi:hypothetical protein
LSGLRSWIVIPSFKLTRTWTIEVFFFIATLTAWAQISQSMPSVLICDSARGNPSVEMTILVAIVLAVLTAVLFRALT